MQKAIIEIEKSYLLKYRRLLRANAARIDSRRDFALCTMRCAFISIAYIGGSGPIPLGLLLKMWEDGMGSGQCPDCGSRTLYVCAGGSPLSGSHSVFGICDPCNKTLRWHWPPLFIENCMPIARRTRAYLDSFEPPLEDPASAQDGITLRDVIRALITISPELAPADCSDLESAAPLAPASDVVGGMVLRGRNFSVGSAATKQTGE